MNHFYLIKYIYITIMPFKNKQIANAIHLACTSFFMGLKPGNLTVATSNSTSELGP